MLGWRRARRACRRVYGAACSGGVEHGAIRASACACTHVCRVSVSHVCVVCVSNAHPIRTCGGCAGRGLPWPCVLIGRRTLAAMAECRVRQQCCVMGTTEVLMPAACAVSGALPSFARRRSSLALVLRSFGTKATSRRGSGGAAACTYVRYAACRRKQSQASRHTGGSSRVASCACKRRAPRTEFMQGLPLPAQTEAGLLRGVSESPRALPDTVWPGRL